MTTTMALRCHRVMSMHHSENLPEPLQVDANEKWEAFLGAAEMADISPPEDPAILDALPRVFAFSDFVAENCIRRPQLLAELTDGGSLQNPYRPGSYTDILDRCLKDIRNDTDLSRMLRDCRRREMVRIAWRDLAGWADLTETMTALSAFADACLEQSLAFLHKQLCSEHGTPIGSDDRPQQLVVIAMGKLGGLELNFSSDIDLVFAYPEPGTTRGSAKSISNEEFFTRLCRRLVNVIGAASPDGVVFRVDLRLRPNGENGPLVLDFDNMEEYYQRQGREWERYAWIKARTAAGDKAAGAQLLDILKPFVFRRYLDFGAFDSLRGMKEKIALEVKQKRIKGNIKLGAGGIREIEFFGQAFQLIRGGVTPELQERSILSVLNTLSKKNYITRETADELENAYVFFRTTEHRLQEVSDQQTHLLPSDGLGKTRLAVSMGFENWESFLSHLKDHQGHVRDHFSSLLAHPDDQPTGSRKQDELDGVWQNLANTDQNEAALTALGFDQTEKVLGLLQNLDNDPATRYLSNDGRKRLGRLIPLVLKAVVLSEHPIPIFTRILELIKTIQGRTSYLALLLENPAALTHLVSLTEASPWVISFLSRHPVLLDELLDPRTLYAPPNRVDLEEEITHSMGQIPRDDLEYQIEQLCIFKQVNMLRISAADVTGALPLMRTSDHLTDLAETVIEQVLDLSWYHLSEKHGIPTFLSGKRNGDRGFAVIAYGKLGGIELGYASDLDLVFLHTGSPGQTREGKHLIDNAHFFSRLGQRVIHLLTAHTRAGRLYQTDVRLRPSGDAGVLVSHIDAFRSYQINDAWTWEHQALIRARVIVGDAQISTAFEAIRKAVLTRFREKRPLQKEVGKMREQMRRESAKSEPGSFDLKQDTGGMVDIEFMVQYLVLLRSHEYPALAGWTDNVRLLETLTQTGVLDGETAQILKVAYLAYRSAAHRLSLQEKAPRVPVDEFRDYREKIERIWDSLINPRQ